MSPGLLDHKKTDPVLAVVDLTFTGGAKDSIGLRRVKLNNNKNPVVALVDMIYTGYAKDRIGLRRVKINNNIHLVLTVGGRYDIHRRCKG